MTPFPESWWMETSSEMSVDNVYVIKHRLEKRLADIVKRLKEEL